MKQRDWSGSMETIQTRKRIITYFAIGLCALSKYKTSSSSEEVNEYAQETVKNLFDNKHDDNPEYIKLRILALEMTVKECNGNFITTNECKELIKNYFQLLNPRPFMRTRKQLRREEQTTSREMSL